MTHLLCHSGSEELCRHTATVSELKAQLTKAQACIDSDAKERDRIAELLSSKEKVLF